MLRSEMLLRMLADSSISTMKVDSPCEMLSEAPTRVNILSTADMGPTSRVRTNPIWAIRMMSAVCSSADLPDMLGPVIIMICCLLVVEHHVVEDVLLPHGHQRLDHRMAP